MLNWRQAGRGGGWLALLRRWMGACRPAGSKDDGWRSVALQWRRIKQDTGRRDGRQVLDQRRHHLQSEQHSSSRQRSQQQQCLTLLSSKR
jgi:hypothetical protein